MADTAAKRDTETQLDRIEELARVMSRQFKEFRQELDRISAAA